MGKYLNIAKKAVTTSLRKACASEWKAAVDDIASRWNSCFEGTDDPLWLNPDEDVSLQGSIGQAIREGDIEETRRLIGKWRLNWLELLK